MPQLRELRVGQGIDIHPLVSGRRFILGGVPIPYSKGLAGHSDADALIHAIVDALLGATGQPDIGSLFPNTQKRWKDLDSREFLRIVWGKLKRQGWEVLNIDATVLAEAPKLSPHYPAMKASLAGLLGITPDRVGLKATTTEQLGFVGRKEGILASAVVLLMRG